MENKKHLKGALALLLSSLALPLQAQYAWQYDAEAGKHKPLHGLEYKVEMQGSASKGQTPLWLNANKYGLSSLEKTNGYVRAALERRLSTDSARRWGLGYGVDVAVPLHYTSKAVVQQAYVEGRWLHGVLTVGSKQYPMELKNNELSSGSQALGINARPVPQVRLALPEYWVLPFGGDWLRLKGHIAYGKLTDSDWQRSFTHEQSKFAEGTLYHSKAGYLMIGNPDRFFPLSLEVGLEMATLFGGKSYSPDGNGGLKVTNNAHGVKSFLKAFLPGGSDAPEVGSAYENEEGDILGSWVARLNYDTDSWRLSLYADKFFEDHSSMLSLDYDGYGTGDEWHVKKHTRFFLYDLKDWLLGAELNLKYGRWLRGIVAEYMYTKYQSGPVYHDHSPGREHHISGQDNYYNHYIYAGWQHWGQSIGNPLYRSPIYNEDGKILFTNNRFTAWHLGFNGEPTERLGYRVLASYLTGYGTYDYPYAKVHHQLSMMAEATYRLPHDWTVRGAYGMDFGHILGANAGFQLTITKTGIFNL